MAEASRITALVPVPYIWLPCSSPMLQVVRHCNHFLVALELENGRELGRDTGLPRIEPSHAMACHTNNLIRENGIYRRGDFKVCFLLRFAVSITEKMPFIFGQAGDYRSEWMVDHDAAQDMAQDSSALADLGSRNACQRSHRGRLHCVITDQRCIIRTYSGMLFLHLPLMLCFQHFVDRYNL